MRWVALALALVSLASNVVGFGAGFIGILPARGGEELFDIAGWCFRAALGAGLAASVVGLFARKKAAKTDVLAVVAAVFGGGGGLLGALVLATAAGLNASTEHQQSADRDARERRSRDVPEVGSSPAEPIAVDALWAEWSADRDATDARRRGHVLAVALRFPNTPSFDEVGAEYLYPYGNGLAHLYPSPATRERLHADASYGGTTTGTLACAYGGSVPQRAVGGKTYYELHLFGCELR